MNTTIPENIKKTSASTYEAITKLLDSNEISQSIFDTIVSTITKTTKGVGKAGEKIIHFLYNDEDEVIARYCNVTHKWFPIDRFAPKSGRVKELDLLMKKEYSRVNKIKKQAEEVFESLTQASPEDKLDILTQYEELKEQATPILPTSEEIEAVEGGFDTVEDIASEMGVEVKTEVTEA